MRKWHPEPIAQEVNFEPIHLGDDHLNNVFEYRKKSGIVYDGPGDHKTPQDQRLKVITKIKSKNSEITSIPIEQREWKKTTFGRANGVWYLLEDRVEALNWWWYTVDPNNQKSPATYEGILIYLHKPRYIWNPRWNQYSAFIVYNGDDDSDGPPPLIESTDSEPERRRRREQQQQDSSSSSESDQEPWQTLLKQRQTFVAFKAKAKPKTQASMPKESRAKARPKRVSGSQNSSSSGVSGSQNSTTQEINLQTDSRPMKAAERKLVQKGLQELKTTARVYHAVADPEEASSLVNTLEPDVSHTQTSQRPDGKVEKNRSDSKSKTRGALVITDRRDLQKTYTNSTGELTILTIDDDYNRKFLETRP